MTTKQSVFPAPGAARYYAATDGDKFCVMMMGTDKYCTEVASSLKTWESAVKKAGSMQNKENAAVTKAAKAAAKAAKAKA